MLVVILKDVCWFVAYKRRFDENQVAIVVLVVAIV
jgi:hypothetical protein